MTNIWVISDTHFGHHNILRFTDHNGELIRGKLFKTIEEHDETIVENWNKTVRPQDHVYHLGDVVIKRQNLSIIKRLNGHKRLVRGNHDVAKTREFIEAGFDEIYGVRVWPKHNLIFSHVPLHPSSLSSRNWKNVHGHLHENDVYKMENDVYIIDDRYQNVSCEKINYTPLLLMT